MLCVNGPTPLGKGVIPLNKKIAVVRVALLKACIAKASGHMQCSMPQLHKQFPSRIGHVPGCLHARLCACHTHTRTC